MLDLSHRSHNYVDLQNLDLILQNFIAFNFEGLAFQYAISIARDVLFVIRSNCTLSELHMLQKTFKLSILRFLMCPLILFVLKEVNSPEAGQDLDMFIPEGPENENFVCDLTFEDNLQFVDVVDSCRIFFENRV